MEPLAEPGPHRRIIERLGVNVPAQNVPKANYLNVTPRVLRWSREPGTRLQVVAIWAFSAALFAIAGGPAAWHVFEIASCATLAFFLWPFIEGPFLLHARAS